MDIIKFAGHEKAEAYKMSIFGGVALFSYGTKVAEVRYGWLHIYGLFSKTTRKHLGWFMRELGLDYQLAKKLYTSYKSMNINTGEIRNWD